MGRFCLHMLEGVTRREGQRINSLYEEDCIIKSKTSQRGFGKYALDMQC